MGNLRRELNVETSFNAIEKWYELEPKIFKNSSKKFKNKILYLQSKQVQIKQQPCET